MVLFGLGMTLAAILIWRARGYGPLNPERVMRLVIPSVATLTLGVQTIFGSFFLSILGLRRR